MKPSTGPSTTSEARVEENDGSLIIQNASLLGRHGLWNITIVDGIIRSMNLIDELDHSVHSLGTNNIIDAASCTVIPGLVDAHVHLDKCFLLDHCHAQRGDFQEAVSETLAAKSAFTYKDVTDRARRLIEYEISFGTTLMRTHVEVDPIIGLVSLEAILSLRKEYERLITIQVAVFAQDGITNQSGQVEMMRTALKMGCDAVGSAPYCDPDPEENIRIVFSLAKEFNCSVDFHLDYHLGGARTYLDFVIQQTLFNKWEGRVLLGHVTYLSVLTLEELTVVGLNLKEAGISVFALPASDICMMGRSDDGNKRRGVCPVDKLLEMGVTAAFATNNIQNLFTFTGDGDVLKIGTLLCQLLHLTSENGAFQCIEMATEIAAKALGVQHFLGLNQSADLVILGSGIKSPGSTPVENNCDLKSNAKILSDGTSYPLIPDTSTQLEILNNPISFSTSSSSRLLPSALLPSALKLLAAPPVDRIVIKRGRVVSRTVVQRTIFR